VAVDPAPASAFFLIVLDAYRLAMMGTPQTHQAYVQSKAFLAQHNPNIREGKTGDWSVGLKGGDMRYVPFNGALGTDQLAWLEQVLENMPHGARAIVTCHVSAQPDSTGPSTTLWDREELLAIFRRFPGKVCLYLSGHDHDGGYAYDAISLTHHLTVAAPIECRPEEEAFAVMDLYDDGCQVYGAGKIPDMFLSFTDHAFN
jgi:manganese-dependent ADP-ribose/CDP-alcohol diphosphatase